MQIVLDEERILRDQRYDLDDMNAIIESVLVDESGLVKGDNGFYYGNGSKDSFSAFMSAALFLKDQAWFLDNVKTWLWFNSDDYPESCCIEDVKEHYRRKLAKVS